MYLTQMGEIPLLTRQQEIALAKKIEITRGRVPPQGAGVRLRDSAAPCKILKRVHRGELPFDRTVQVSVTERLEKDQILGRHAAQPADARTAAASAIADDYRIATSKSAQARTAAKALGSGSAVAAAGRCSWSKNSASARSGSSR